MVGLGALFVGSPQAQAVPPELHGSMHHPLVDLSTLPDSAALDSLNDSSTSTLLFTPVYQLEHSLDEFLPGAVGSSDLAESGMTKDDDEDDDDDDDELEPSGGRITPFAFLEGEVIFGVSSASGRDLDDSIVFQGSAEFTLNVSFTGEDLLSIGLEGGIAEDFSFTEDITFEGSLDSPSDTDGGQIELGDLYYEFPVGDRTSLYISATGDDIEDFNPFLDDALSDFGSENPISELLQDFGVQLNYEVADPLELMVGYFSEDGSDPELGLFRGNYSAVAQLGF